jgi:nitroimidazol reductase NimA-like FMN-containing flavoprotein (pyridoxamine 5'-phosphate oxidase superfamily)
VVPDDDRMTGRLTELDPEACRDLLGRCTVGRIAVNQVALGPLVVPVNYVLDRDVIVFRTDEGTKQRALADGPVSFQIDGFDHAHGTGWSVLVRGVAYEADAWEVDRLELEPWAEGARHHWMRLVIGVLSGRRIELSTDDLDERGYR